MEGSIRIARIAGVDIGIHFSWIFIFLLVTWSVATGYLPGLLPGLEPVFYWILGAISSLLLFVSVLLHELSHSLVARARGMGVHGITLFLFGGVSTIHGESDSPGQEFQIAAVGPLSSLVLAAVCLGFAVVVGQRSPAVFALLAYLATINLGLAIFNLIPGYPLDGGRVLRSIIWAGTGDRLRATTIASIGGTVVACLFLFAGLLMSIGGGVIGGLWMVFIGWFLFNAAAQTRQDVQRETAFVGIRVSDVMLGHPTVVSPTMPLTEAIYSHVLTQKVPALPVVDGERLVGIMTVNDLRLVCQADWPHLTVGDVMGGRDGVRTASPEMPLADAVDRLAEGDYNQLPVVDRGRVVGLLSRSDVGRFLQLRQATAIAPSHDSPRAA